MTSGGVSPSLQLAVYAISFLLGSIPFGILIARLFKVGDLTQKGSGNIGATNVSRVVGFWPAGFLTFALDVIKGALPVFLVSFSGLSGFWSGLPISGGSGEFSTMAIWLTGLMAVLGHCFSPWVHFKGGKGVATGFGVILVLSPWAALAGIAAFALAFVTKRIGSLASMSGLMVAAVTHLVFQPIGAHLWVGAAILFLILLRHEGNIDALLDGRERAFR